MWSQIVPQSQIEASHKSCRHTWCPLAEETDACVRHDLQAKMHSDLTLTIFVDQGILFYFVQRVNNNISKLIFLNLQQEV